MWSFFGCRFLEGDISSLWYELGAKNANKKTPNVHLFLQFGLAEVVTTMEVSNIRELFFPIVQA
jgi:hypothetical protein